MRAAGRYSGLPACGLHAVSASRLLPIDSTSSLHVARDGQHFLCRVNQPTTAACVSAFHAALSVAILTSCAPLEQRPPEVRTNTITVQIPIAVPCFTEDQRPTLPPDTPVDPDTATTEQLVAAKLADAIAREIYAAKVDALFTACSKGPQ